ncbi:YcxB family protein [Shewanella gaetbuli]|uniref:YcxB family protein n=1 Tax=Shewanella gaetbuli TaxID=220752 RepID=A0A9X1ZK76_9GAMM|nr:YcxB family protein [Shewanella gaetbuli]MCL1141367.1 YcxB family protein [Shewanella gaetbuli]
MTSSFTFSHEFTLNKAYFAETYDASVDSSVKPKDFIKAGLFALAGIAILLLTSTGDEQLANKNMYYLGYFFVGLAVVEALSIKFKRTWWLWRQMMSKAANNPATITIDDDGIATKSAYVNHQIRWTDMYRITESESGFLITLAKGKSYLSKQGLSEAAMDFIRQKN